MCEVWTAGDAGGDGQNMEKSADDKSNSHQHLNWTFFELKMLLKWGLNFLLFRKFLVALEVIMVEMSAGNNKKKNLDFCNRCHVSEPAPDKARWTSDENC